MCSDGWDNQLVDIVCGGIVGKIENENVSGWIRNCINNADIYVYGYTREEQFTASYDIDSHHGVSGGIVGECTPNICIESCVNLGDVTSSAITSGIVSLVGEHPQNENFVVLNCQNFGKVEVLKEEGKVDHNYKIGHKASGIIGVLKGGSASINFCNNFGEINVEDDYEFGGSLIAHSETDKLEIKDCMYVNNAEYDCGEVSMDGKNGMYPESYNNKQISLAEAKKLFPEYFNVSDTTPVRF